MNKILIVYATWTGATRTVAESIGDELQNFGIQVEVVRAGKAKNISSNQAVIVCASVHMGQLPGELKRFIKSNRKVLSNMPLAYCIVCLAFTDEKEENRMVVKDYIGKMRQIVPELDPVSEVAVFGGAVLADTPEFKHLFPLFKVPLRSMAAQPDHRNWDAIRDWTKDIAPKLSAS